MISMYNYLSSVSGNDDKAVQISYKTLVIFVITAVSMVSLSYVLYYKLHIIFRFLTTPYRYVLSKLTPRSFMLWQQKPSRVAIVLAGIANIAVIMAVVFFTL